MNKYVYLWCVATALFMVGCCSNSDTASSGVHLKGHLVDMGTNQVPLIEDGTASLLKGSDHFIIHTDDTGYFDTIVPITQPGYYKIKRNTLYLTPGDDMTIRITQDNEEASFTGVGAEANNYMKYRLYPHAGSFLQSGDNLREDFAKTKQHILELSIQKRKQLEKVKCVSEEFRRLEEARIKGDIINSYLLYPSYANLYDPEMTDEALMDTIENFYRSITDDVEPLYRELKDTTFLNVGVVRDVMAYVYQPFTPALETWKEMFGMNDPFVTELYRAYSYFQKLDHQKSPEVIREATAYADSIDYPMIQEQLKRKLETVTRTVANSPAIDFTMEDINGDTLRLSDLRGKVLYLDFWATWCGPCINVSPYFEALAKKYRDNDKIRFVAISIDSDKKAWQDFLTAHPKEIVQYRSNDIVLNTEWEISSIPRFILIDEDFKIIDSNAPHPDTPEIEALLEEALK